MSASASPTSVREVLKRARAEGRCALVPYLTMGYPSLETSVALLRAIEAMGVDAVEVGIPFSDPVADGPTIQRTTDVALRQGVSLRGCLARLAEPDARAQGPGARILFSYLNPLLAYGLDPLGGALTAAGLGSVLVTDLIPEEAHVWNRGCAQAGLETCFLVASTSDEARVAEAVRCSTGFVYVVSTLGVTGARRRLDDGARATVARVRAAGEVPVAVGFGIATADDVRRVREFADAAVVGSALLQAIGDEDDPAAAVKRAQEFLTPLLEAAHR